MRVFTANDITHAHINPKNITRQDAEVFGVLRGFEDEKFVFLHGVYSKNSLDEDAFSLLWLSNSQMQYCPSIKIVFKQKNTHLSPYGINYSLIGLFDSEIVNV